MKKITIFTAMIIAAILTMSYSVEAQVYKCKCENGIKCEYFYDADGNIIDTRCDPNLTCEGDFEFVEPPIPPTGPINTSGQVQRIEATTDLGELGKATLRLNEDEQSPATTVRSNGDERFPATVEINFYAVATLEASGEEYVSLEPLTYRTDEAKSIAPFESETLVLANKVNFVKRDEPDHVVFTIIPGESSLTLGPGDEGR
jgi:hypothetical protein